MRPTIAMVSRRCISGSWRAVFGTPPAETAQLGVKRQPVWVVVIGGVQKRPSIKRLANSSRNTPRKTVKKSPNTSKNLNYTIATSLNLSAACTCIDWRKSNVYLHHVVGASFGLLKTQPTNTRFFFHRFFKSPGVCQSALFNRFI